uniref:peptidyl-tRNA hydrolase n=1 Tax=Caligus rogercresseyi TaxID=217165 RepID=C1BR11_CALRO|nr:Peptidyl-tRNA hydrolase 2, mitochondrial precursor [Caligus rogercresseyi]
MDEGLIRPFLLSLGGLVTGWLACSLFQHGTHHTPSKKEEPPMGRNKELLALAQRKGCKMVLIVRTDLKMSKGKTAAQCCHAALEAYKRAKSGGSRAKQVLRLWETIGQKKVTLKADSEEQLLELHRTANEKGLISAIIKDAGKTEVEPGTLTVLAIGPDVEPKVDEVSGTLKLLH